MAKKAVNLVLLIISIGIILFIINAFYRVFTKEPTLPDEYNTSSVNESATQSTVSGTITSPNSPTDTTNTATETTQTEEESTQESSINTETPSAVETSETTSLNSDEEELEEEPGKLLQEQPLLRNALPPVPMAPPAATSPEESTVLSAETLPLNENISTLSEFPAPIQDTSTPQFPDPISSGSTSFPAPINSDSNSTFPDPQ
ncbi:hypothetical protein [Pelistega ratti]|uniref:hypothetical protein n=1 Tax=Pelistega ratti TaxID=2652177 RepID=UPI00135ADAC2|nr:hypothetical protein [Pelistega ratti]